MAGILRRWSRLLFWLDWIPDGAAPRLWLPWNLCIILSMPTKWYHWQWRIHTILWINHFPLGNLFLQFWGRQEYQWSYQWGTLVNEYERQTCFEVRTEFKGKLIISPVTGRIEVHYPQFKRRLKITVSAILTPWLLSVWLEIILKLLFAFNWSRAWWIWTVWRRHGNRDSVWLRDTLCIGLSIGITNCNRGQLDRNSSWLFQADIFVSKAQVDTE